MVTEKVTKTKQNLVAPGQSVDNTLLHNTIQETSIVTGCSETEQRTPAPRFGGDWGGSTESGLPAPPRKVIRG